MKTVIQLSRFLICKMKIINMLINAMALKLGPGFLLSMIQAKVEFGFSKFITGTILSISPSKTTPCAQYDFEIRHFAKTSRYKVWMLVSQLSIEIKSNRTIKSPLFVNQRQIRQISESIIAGVQEITHITTFNSSPNRVFGVPRPQVI